MENQTFDLTTLFEKRAADVVAKEANQFPTLPSGKYRLTVEKVEGRIGSEQSPWPGAELIHLQIAAQSPDRKGKLFQDISYQTLRRQNGKLDTPTKLWGQYEKALGVIGKSAGEVLEAIRLYPVDAYVSESFKTLEGYRTPRTDAERTQFTDANYEIRNFIQNVFQAK